MIVNAFAITDALWLESITPDAAVEMSRSAEARVWVDVQMSDGSGIEEWLDRLEVDDLSRRLCLEAREHPGFYPFKDEIFLNIPILDEAESQIEVDHVAFLCRQNLLLTLHRRPVLDLEKLASLQASDTWLPSGSIAGLVAALMMEQSIRGLRRGTGLRTSVGEVEDRMDQDPDEVEVEEILDMRSELVALGALVGDQLPIVNALSVTDRPYFRLADGQDFLNCALANVQATDGAIGWVDQRLGALRAGFQMHAQDKTNRRLNMLTILSAIFSPITLLAGIWGMNFQRMPELSLPYAYPIALAIMGLVGLGMYLFFQRHDWLD